MRGEASGEGEQPSPGGRIHHDSDRKSSDSEDEDSEASNQSGVSNQLTEGTEEATALASTFPPPNGDYPAEGEEEEEEEDEDEEEEEDEEEDAIEVVVETLLGDIYRVRVSQWDTPAGLKDLLYQTQGIPPNHLHLIHGERELAEETCLMEQGVVNGSKLRLVLAMKGGPINPRHIPSTEELFMRDLTDYMYLNKEELWEGTEGRTVTLLVLREGDNVNLYRVVENQDGSYSPLNESWGSFGGVRSEEGVTQQASEEEAKTKARMTEILEQLKKTKIKKNKKDKRKTPVSLQQSLNSSFKNFPEMSEDIPSPRLDLIESVAHHPLATPIATPLATPRQHSAGRWLNTSRRGSKGSRPNTQEHSESVRSTLSRSTLRELPSANPPVPVDFTRRKPLESIRPQGNRLSAVEENRRNDSPVQFPETPNTQVINKNYDSYRKSIVNHGIVRDSDTSKVTEIERDSHEVWPRRDPSRPLYRLPDSNRYDRDRLNRSHNPDLLRSVHQSAMTRPKTSPEVLEHRPNTTGNQSTVSDRIHLRDPDEKLREMCSILGSPGHSSHSKRPTNFPPGNISQPLSLSSSLSGGNTLRHRNNSVSVSLASLRSRGGTPPSPGNGALVTSGSREQRDALRGLMRNQGAVSRRTTPDHPPMPTRRPPSGRVQRGSTHLPPVTPQRHTPRRRQRCGQCSRRLSVATTYECRCGGIFCAQHRYAETHTCNFDYRTAGRTMIAMANPYVAPNKLPKI